MTRPEVGGASPFFIVRDVPAALAFYRDQLGFEITFQGPPDDIFFGIVQRGRAMIMMKDVDVDPLPNRNREPGVRWDAYVYVPDPDALAAEFASRNVEFLESLKDTHDDLRGFEIKDRDGYVLFFGRPVHEGMKETGTSERFPRSEKRVFRNSLSDHRMESSQVMQAGQFTRTIRDLSALRSIFSLSKIQLASTSCSCGFAFLTLIPELQMRSLLSGLAILVLTACQPSASKTVADASAATDSAAQLAHEAYTTAINSNNLDSLAEMFTDDVVFLAAHSPPIVGKPAVRAWAKDYLDAFTTHWDKTSQEFKVAGEWAFERYSYKSTDTPKTGGTPIEDTGWGLVIYHHDTDGKWRVARDAFSTEAALPTK